MAVSNLADKALCLLCFLVFTVFGCNFHELLEVHVFAIKAFGQSGRVRRFHMVHNIGIRSHVQILMLCIIVFHRRHFDSDFLDIVLFHESRTHFAHNPLAIVRDETFLDFICNLDFTRRISQVSMLIGISLQGVHVRFNVLCISDFITKIHVGKRIRELVTMLVVEESEFVVAIHQAIHRIEALVCKSEQVVFHSSTMGSKLILEFRILLKSNCIEGLAAEKGTRSLSHCFGIGNDVPHTHHKGVVFLENRFTIHPGYESILVSDGIAPCKKEGTERKKRKQSLFHIVLMNMCA